MESVKRFLRQLQFTFEEAITNFVRSGWMSGIVVMTMVASLSIFGAFFLLVHDINYMAESVGSKLQIIVFSEKRG